MDTLALSSYCQITFTFIALYTNENVVKQIHSNKQ